MRRIRLACRAATAASISNKATSMRGRPGVLLLAWPGPELRHTSMGRCQKREQNQERGAEQPVKVARAPGGRLCSSNSHRLAAVPYSVEYSTSFFGAPSTDR